MIYEIGTFTETLYFNRLLKSSILVKQWRLPMKIHRSYTGARMGTGLRLLDLFCKAGGCSMGYKRAGFFEIVGVDISPQPNYPFTFVQSDAMEILKDKIFLQSFDFVHASPPCQGYSWSARKWEHHRTKTPKLVGDVRRLLKEAGVYYVIENVVGAPLEKPVYLEGPMFKPDVSVDDPGVIRRRLFETNWPLPQPPRVKPKGSIKSGLYCTVAGHGGDGRAAKHLWQKAMGIGWMTKKEMAEAIPPAYTQYIGERFILWKQAQQIANVA